ncbi:MAG: GGDEF domain-containing protein [Lysobacter sp.]
MSLQRLRTDFQFAILIVFCAIGLIALTPFTVLRFINGPLSVAVMDVAIMAGIGLVLAYVWRGGNLEKASLLVALLNTFSGILFGALLGLSGVLWSYPVVLANFLLLSRGKAIVVSTMLVLALLAQGTALETPMMMARFAVASVAVGVLAYIFSYRAELQRGQLQRLADRDPLTGAYNRRAMERELRIAIEVCRRHPTPVGLLLLDLDHFKRINDAFGHEAGDGVLVDLAQLVTRSTRQGDRFFRYGGEEFVLLLLPGGSVESLQAVGEFLRATAAAELRHDDQSVTLSIGGALLQPGEDAAQWLARADAAMYRAKQQGRDRVVVDEGGEVAEAATTALPGAEGALRPSRRDRVSR